MPGQIDLGSIELGTGFCNVGAQFLDADARLLVLSARRKPLLEKALHTIHVDLGSLCRSLCRVELCEHLSALVLETVDEIRIDVGDAHDRVTDRNVTSVANEPLLLAAGNERIDFLHAVVRVQGRDGTRAVCRLDPRREDEEGR